MADQETRPPVGYGDTEFHVLVNDLGTGPCYTVARWAMGVWGAIASAEPISPANMAAQGWRWNSALLIGPTVTRQMYPKQPDRVLEEPPALTLLMTLAKIMKDRADYSSDRDEIGMAMARFERKPAANATIGEAVEVEPGSIRSDRPHDTNYMGPSRPEFFPAPVQSMVPRLFQDSGCRESIRKLGAPYRICPNIKVGEVKGLDELRRLCVCFAISMKHFP